MADRLAELVRQRALVQEHLAWLDREIAGVAQESPSGDAESLSRERRATPDTIPVTSPALPVDAEAILAQHRLGVDTVKENVRKGCFLYFAAALIVLVLGVTVLYFTVGAK